MNSWFIRKCAELGAPLGSIAYACIAQGIPFYSLEPVALVFVFAVVQAILRYFLFDAIQDLFIASNKEGQFWLMTGICYLFIGLGVVQLYILTKLPLV